MDDQPRSRHDRQRLLALVAILAIALVTALGFARMFDGGGAAWKLLLVAALSTLLATALERRSLLVAALASVAALIVTLGILVFPETTMAGLPTLGTLGALGQALGEVGAQAREQVAPTPPLPPLLLAALASVWAAAFSVHALAVRAGSPLLALMPAIALIAFADSALDGVGNLRYAAVLLAGALLVLCADGFRRLRRWGTIRSWSGPSGRRWAPVARGAGLMVVSAVVIALALPGLLPGIDAQALVDLTSSPDDGTDIDPFVSIQADLAEREPVELFRVETDRASYWRLLALDRFDGVTWSSSDPSVDGGTEVLSGSLLTTVLGPDILTSGPASDLRTSVQRMTVSSELEFPWVPVAYAPTRVSIEQSSFRFDGERITVLPFERLTEGDTYSASSLVVEPEAEDLRPVALAPEDPGGADTALPNSIPRAIFGIADRWTAGAATPYDEVLAIQQHLRDTSEFTYDTDVQPRSDADALLDFLTSSKRGFCQQFSSAMAVLVRAIGYPARIAIGFTQGSSTSTGQYTVTTENAHSWVEVLFPGYGWLAFEPTPGRSNPGAAYLTPQSPCPNPAACPAGTASGGRGGQAQGGRAAGDQSSLARRRAQGADSAAPVTPPPGGRRLPIGPVLGLLVLVGLVAVVVIPPAKAVRRRFRLVRAREPRTLVLATYDVFSARAGDLGLGRAPGETMHQYECRLEHSARGAADDLERLTAIATRAAYAPTPSERPDARAADQAARNAIRSLRRSRGAFRRLWGVYRAGL